MYEPTIAILEDIRFRGISDIYSLGDNTSLGPNPREVLDLMDKYNVNQIMGNSEYYLTLGGSPFNYWNEERERSLDWTNDRVQGYINDLKLYNIDLLDMVEFDKNESFVSKREDGWIAEKKVEYAGKTQKELVKAC
jgi:hypothetical protein